MTYTLKLGDMTAVADTRGGELISFRDEQGKEYLWQGDPQYWSGRNPILFPVVGGLKDGRVCFDGKPYEMARHGFARNSTFSLVEEGDDYVIFELVDSETTLQRYPFHFRLRVRHQLIDNGFSTCFEVTNTGSVPLPFCIGAHTAFNCPGSFEDHRLVFDHPEDAHAMIPTPQGCLDSGRTEYTLPSTDTIPLDHETFDRVDTLVFHGLRSTGVRLLGADGHGVRMDFEGLPLIAFWSPVGKNAPFVCVEPWHGCAAFEDESGEFTDKPWCITLQPGQSKALRYTVTLV